MATKTALDDLGKQLRGEMKDLRTELGGEMNGGFGTGLTYGSRSSRWLASS